MNQDLTTRMVASVIDHWPLVAALAVVVKWGFPWAIKVTVPPVMRSYFNNGGGEQIRAIVKAENEAQSRDHKAELDRRLHQHEAEEKDRFRQGEERFRRIEDEIDEITGSYPLRRARRRRSRRG